MHLCCPRCDTAVNVKDYNLFEIWMCEACEWRFRGVHARFPGFRNLVNSFIAPIYTNTQILHKSTCPHCATIIDLRYIGLHTYAPRPFGQYPSIGYNGPYVCKGCHRDLPWEYPHQLAHVARAFNEDLAKRSNDPKKEASQPKKETSHSDSSMNLSKMAQDLYRNKHKTS